VTPADRRLVTVQTENVQTAPGAGSGEDFAG